MNSLRYVIYIFKTARRTTQWLILVNLVYLLVMLVWCFGFHDTYDDAYPWAQLLYVAALMGGLNIPPRPKQKKGNHEAR